MKYRVVLHKMHSNIFVLYYNICTFYTLYGQILCFTYVNIWAFIQLCFHICSYLLTYI